MKFMIFEGTTQEFTVVAPSMGLKPPNSPEKTEEIAADPSEDAEASEYMTVNQVKAVLGRRHLDESMKTMLVELYKNGEERVSSDTLKEALDFSPEQFRGMLGAFGRRRANTQGVPKSAQLFDQVWDHELHQKTWTLPPNTRKALEDLGVV
jgi:hypothetical protein